MESQAKLNEKYMHVFWYIVFQALKLLLIKIYKTEQSTSSFISYCFTSHLSAFTCADIMFYNVLGTNTTIFVTNSIF